MTYIVIVGYYEFTFTDRSKALGFAETALKASNEKRSVKIELEPEVENE